jgi:uncharacterized phage protein gp47/JayE
MRTKTQIQDLLLENFNGVTPNGVPINKREGSLVSDLFAAVAIYGGGTKDKSIIGIEEKIENIPLQAFLQTATEDIYIIEACKMLGVYRKAGEKAAGYLTVKGVAETVVLAGTIVSNGIYNYITTENLVLDTNGDGIILVIAENLGSQYNTLQNTITSLVTPITNITSVTNNDSFTNGTDVEAIEELRARGLYVKRNPPINGNMSFYKLLAENLFLNSDGGYILEGVDGVKSARVFSASPNPGDVTVVITNSVGEPASNTLVEGIQEVMNDNRFLSANVIVESAVAKNITISATLNLSDTIELENITENLRLKIRDHLRNVFSNGKVKVNSTELAYVVSWSEIGNIIFDDANVMGYVDLKINDASENFILGDKETPVLTTVNFEV